jgi:hypothetical protein
MSTPQGAPGDGAKPTDWISISLRIGAIIFAIVVASIGLALKGCGHDPHADQHQAAAQEAVGSATTFQPAASAPAQVAEDSGTACPQFDTAGATCDIGTDGTRWIRPNKDQPNLTFCWTPQNQKKYFREIWYLDSVGQKQPYDPALLAPQHIQGMKFVPYAPLTFVYNLADHCQK